jgi:hypothetical protein
MGSGLQLASQKLVRTPCRPMASLDDLEILN